MVVINNKKLLQLLNSNDAYTQMLRISLERANNYIVSNAKDEVGERRLLRLQTLLLEKGYLVITEDRFNFDSEHVIMDDTLEFIKKVGEAA